MFPGRYLFPLSLQHLKNCGRHCNMLTRHVNFPRYRKICTYTITVYWKYEMLYTFQYSRSRVQRYNMNGFNGVKQSLKSIFDNFSIIWLYPVRPVTINRVNSQHLRAQKHTFDLIYLFHYLDLDNTVPLNQFILLFCIVVHGVSTLNLPVKAAVLPGT